MASHDGPERDKNTVKQSQETSLEDLSVSSSSVKAVDPLAETSLTSPKISLETNEDLLRKEGHDHTDMETLERRMSRPPKLETSLENTTEMETPISVSNKKSPQAATRSTSQIDMSGETVIDKLISFIASLIKILEKWLLKLIESFAPEPTVKINKKQSSQERDEGVLKQNPSSERDIESGFPGQFDDDESHNSDDDDTDGNK